MVVFKQQRSSGEDSGNGSSGGEYAALLLNKDKQLPSRKHYSYGGDDDDDDGDDESVGLPAVAVAYDSSDARAIGDEEQIQAKVHPRLGPRHTPQRQHGMHNRITRHRHLRLPERRHQLPADSSSSSSSASASYITIAFRPVKLALWFARLPFSLTAFCVSLAYSLTMSALFYAGLVAQQLGVVAKGLIEGPQRPNRDRGLDIFVRVFRSAGGNKKLTVDMARDMTSRLNKLGEKRAAQARKHINIREVQWTVTGVPLGDNDNAAEQQQQQQQQQQDARVHIRGLDMDKQGADDWTVSADWITHKHVKPQDMTDMVVLYLHGGAYFLSSKQSYRHMLEPVARTVTCRVFSVEYRLAPEYVFPAALHDAVSAYVYLTEHEHIDPSKIVLGGDSAGGNLSMALLLYLRDHDYPMPAGAMLMSPWVDLSHDLPSLHENAPYDYIRPWTSDNAINPSRLFLGDDNYLDDGARLPLVSPVYDDCHKLPPVLFSAGTDEILMDENILLAIKLARAGSKVRFELYEHQIHAFPLVSMNSPDTAVFLSSMRTFMADAYARSSSSQSLPATGVTATPATTEPTLPAAPVTADVDDTTNKSAEAVADKVLAQEADASDQDFYRFVYYQNQRASNGAAFCRERWQKIRQVKKIDWDFLADA
ncbi:hypothetical protein RI367_000232 [Sorochytrium milnesiophthora]